EEYRQIDPKLRKRKTAFVRESVDRINALGGRFVDSDKSGRYYVVTMEKARKKTSQALRETKTLMWLDLDKKTMKKGTSSKDVVCPFCKKPGHKTRIAKSCDFHHQWLDAGKSSNDAVSAAEAGAQAAANAIAVANAGVAAVAMAQMKQDDVGAATEV
ncbi:MAG: hypothetical protein SGARI_003426, partial [Bacillariaceae sp.]